MRVSTNPFIGLLAGCLLVAPGIGAAGVSPEEAAKLGDQLTPIGANPNGNEEGTIPPWRGPSLFTEAQRNYDYEEVEHLRKNDPDKLNFIKTQRPEALKPRFTITADNYQQYADKLTAGHKRLFELYPETYKMRVYPSVRGTYFPDEINEATRKNAERAGLEGVNDVYGARLGFPFPIPQNGAQAIWNHKLRFRGSAVKRYNNQAIVDADGSYQITKLIEDVRFEYANLEVEDPENHVLAYYLQRTLSPARVAGQITLVHEIFGKGTSGRNAWIYNPGLGRVNRAPEVGYDNPSLGSDGLQFNDQINMFNGSLARYNWKLVGKKEMFVPHNSYEINSVRHSYDEIIQKGHINQNLPRYELQRVWVVEANLREGTRHQFKKRVFYLHEDSWGVTMVDCYDNRDQLWKFQEGHLITAPYIPTATTVPEVIYDLQSGRYFMTAMINEDRANDFDVEFSRSHFQPSNLKRMGRTF
ncbi:hypothetical protein PC39_06679 [Salinisphaera sp. PC39]|uniref:DUF1329 domain-containing protein n=1 Tax=Salinisphaera sp. PC39 TaxID=1304156 RepID=UPI00333EB820